MYESSEYDDLEDVDEFADADSYDIWECDFCAANDNNSVIEICDKCGCQFCDSHGESIPKSVYDDRIGENRVEYTTLCQICLKEAGLTESEYDDLEDVDEFDRDTTLPRYREEWWENSESLEGWDAPEDQLVFNSEFIVDISNQELWEQLKQRWPDWEAWFAPVNTPGEAEGFPMMGIPEFIKYLETETDILSESEYDDLEDVDKFSTGKTCEVCGRHDDGTMEFYECRKCTDKGWGALTSAICSECAGLQQAMQPNRRRWEYTENGFNCPLCTLGENPVTESEYDDLEDVDEFEQASPPYDPIYDEFDYQYLGPYKGSQLTFRGDTYVICGGTVYKDGQKFALTSDEVPWDDESFIWNGPADGPDSRGGEWSKAVKFSWRELLNELQYVFGNHDNGDPPPGVPVYESEYDDLEDVDEFQEPEDICHCGQPAGIRCEQCREYFCPDCVRDGGGISICDGCWDDWADVMDFEEDLYESSEYDDLEDVDEFDDEGFPAIQIQCPGCGRMVPEEEGRPKCENCGHEYCYDCYEKIGVTEDDTWFGDLLDAGLWAEKCPSCNGEPNGWRPDPEIGESSEYEGLEDVDEFEEEPESEYCSHCGEMEADYHCDDCGDPVCSGCGTSTSMGDWCADCAIEADVFGIASQVDDDEEVNFWLREEDEYEGLEDVDQFQELDNGVWLQITAMKLGLNEDDLINGAREVLARNGYQVGDFQADGHGSNPRWVSGYMELPDYAAWRPREYEGYDVEVYIPARDAVNESEYEDLDDVDEFEQGEIVEGPVWCGINALRAGMTEPEMIEAAKEVMAEAGYNVTGDFDIVDRGDYDDNLTGPRMADGVAVYDKSQEVRHIKHWLCGHLDVGPIPLEDELQFRGHDVEVIIPVP
jgi:hypothetical protein